MSEIGDLSQYDPKIAIRCIRLFAYHDRYTKTHRHIETITKSFPPDEKGLIICSIKRFIKKGWLEEYKTKHGFQVKLTKKGAKKFWPLMEKIEKAKKEEYGLSRILKCVVF